MSHGIKNHPTTATTYVLIPQERIVRNLRIPQHVHWSMNQGGILRVEARVVEVKEELGTREQVNLSAAVREIEKNLGNGNGRWWSY
jgi:hypothetical protein